MLQTILVAPQPNEPAANPFDTLGEPIYALTVTGKDLFHTPLARNAIISFLAQTYGNRFLVIVNDGPFTFDFVGVPKERIIQVQLSERLVLGALRNKSLDHVPADAIWVQWDDDDWHHSSLLAEQYEVLKSRNANTCFLKHQVKFAFSTNTGWADFFPGGFAGTLMSRNVAGICYPELAKSEDSMFCLALKDRGNWVAWDNPPHYYLRFIHGHNTWPDSHFRLDQRKANQWIMPAASAEYLNSVLPLYEPIFRAVRGGA